jgi:hypothetical protein
MAKRESAAFARLVAVYVGSGIAELLCKFSGV